MLLLLFPNNELLLLLLFPNIELLLLLFVKNVELLLFPNIEGAAFNPLLSILFWLLLFELELVLVFWTLNLWTFLVALNS